MFLFTGCGELAGLVENESQDDPKKSEWYKSIGDNKYLFVGTASNSGSSSHSFETELKLPAGETLKLFFFANDQLESGVEIELQREDSGHINMKYKLNSVSNEVELTDFEAGEDNIHLLFDVHNDETDTHAMIWNKSKHEEGEHEEGEHEEGEHEEGEHEEGEHEEGEHEEGEHEEGEHEEGEHEEGEHEHGEHEHGAENCMSKRTCLFNSAEIDELTGSGKASGTFWGISISNIESVLSVDGPNEPIKDH